MNDVQARWVRLTASDILEPEIPDDSGYCIRQRDIDFLQISIDNVEAWRRRSALLGMDDETYREFVRACFDKLEADDVKDADVRVQGSSAQFFSGTHKTLPTTREAMRTAYEKDWTWAPTEDELDGAQALLADWCDDGLMPKRRPFDCMHKLRLSPNRSDYDLQVSSDALCQRASGLAGSDDIFHPRFGFVLKPLARAVAPRLTDWAERLGVELDRPITVAVFRGSGPEENLTEGEPSSHFRDDVDWKVLKAKR